MSSGIPVFVANNLPNIPWAPKIPRQISLTQTLGPRPRCQKGEQVSVCILWLWPTSFKGGWNCIKNMLFCWRWIPIFFELASRFLEKTRYCYFLIGAIDSHKRVMYFFYTWKNPSRPSCDDLMEILKPTFGKFFFLDFGSQNFEFRSQLCKSGDVSKSGQKTAANAAKGRHVFGYGSHGACEVKQPGAFWGRWFGWT